MVTIQSVASERLMATEKLVGIVGADSPVKNRKIVRYALRSQAIIKEA